MPSFGRKTYTYKLVGEQRKSKIVNDAGCGALVEFPGFSGIMGGQNMWPQDGGFNLLKIHERNLEEKLGKEYFIQVSTYENGDNTTSKSYRIPVVRFPDFYYCPTCHQLDFASKIAKNLKSDKKRVEPLLCNKCEKSELIPSRFVLVCEDGHIDDFPYDWWVHKGIRCSNSKLKLEYAGKTSGLEGIKITCETCGKSNTMANVLNKEATVMLKCQGKSPWLGPKHFCDCGKPVRVLMRGSNSIYYPEQESALTIPPWSNIIQKAIDDRYEALNAYMILENIDLDMKKSLVSSYFNAQNLGDILKCTVNEFAEQVLMRFGLAKKGDGKKNDIEYDEYLAFTGPDKDDYYFKTQTSEIADELKPYFEKVKLVKRLREVKVLKSFSRISAFHEEDGGKSAPISTFNEKWLPAAELLGEGIFIEFPKKLLNSWVLKLNDRYEKMKGRYNKANLGPRYGSFSPILIALHTFSHLFIRELAYNCGYDTSSLSEKIYFSDGTEKEWMAGLLVYTATTCSDGSLGGLVRQGTTNRLKETVFSMLNRASWCSNDPICIDATAQGLNALNYAACHACTLIPEISCKYLNTVLDRYAIVGCLEDREIGLFGRLLV